MATITKKIVIAQISKQFSMPLQEVRDVLQAFLDGIGESLSNGDRFEFRDFGVFDAVVRKQKIGRNPKHPKISIIIPERTTVKFSPGKKLTELIKNGKSK